VDLFLPRGAPPAVVRFLAFRNHYAHAVTVRARDAHGTWRDVLRDTRLMADPHYEDDATQIAVLELPNEGVSLDGRDESAVRVYFSNPSPRWAHVEVGASHFAAYESGDPEVMLAELTRRVQRAIREARAGGAGGEPTRADEKRNSLRERETPFAQSRGRSRRDPPRAPPRAPCRATGFVPTRSPRSTTCAARFATRKSRGRKRASYVPRIQSSSPKKTRDARRPPSRRGAL
jgi:hypothetical protein